jgi:hypothetical protein
MNGVALNTRDARKRGKHKAFAQGMSGMVDGMGRLFRFHHAHVTRIVSSIEAPGSTVPVPQYIDHATRSRPSASLAFDALLLGMGVEREQRHEE